MTNQEKPHKGRIEDYVEERWGDRWFITGRCFGHPDFADGTDIRTSRLVSRDLRSDEVETLNSRYTLGKRFDDKRPRVDAVVDSMDPPLPEVGAVYQHYKGNSYKILHNGFNESDMSRVVVYIGMLSDKVFVRPLNSFYSLVRRPEPDPRLSDTVPRFKRLP